MAASNGVSRSNETMYKMKPILNTDEVELPKVMYPMKVINGSSISDQSSEPSADSPLAYLERKQLNVLHKLDKLKVSVEQLAQQYDVSSSSSVPTSSSVPSSSTESQSSKNLGPCVHDLVISADPSQVPLSLLLVCQQLECQYSVYKSTFVHSSVSGQVPDSLQHLLVSNGHGSRTACQVALTLVWKKAPNGPELMVDPTRQSPIQGEANVIRYLARLLQPAYDDTEDLVTACQIDDFLDLAQIQILEGNAKEKTAAVRTLNSSLGKKDWLVGSKPSIADFICWSALCQTGQTAAPPANVKRWLSGCCSHQAFSIAQPFAPTLVS